MPNNGSNENTSSEVLLAGAFAAFTVDLLIYPLDTLKTRLQSKDYKKRFVDASTNTVKKNVFFRGLYQGVGSVLLATLPSSGAFFLTYESAKSVMNPLATYVPLPVVHAAASGTAELVSCAILTPAEVIKQNAQMVSSDSRTQATFKTIQHFKSRPSSLFNGYVALAARNLPFTALQFPLFEKLRDKIHQYRDISPEKATLKERAVITGVSAGAAGSIAAGITTPVDVVKTRVMLEAAEERRSNEWKVFREVLKREGTKGLWRGGALRGVWTLFGSGLYLGMYDLGRVYLGRRRGIEVEDID